MGWKALKEHYRIRHAVQVEEKGICIGSPYVHDLITVDPITGAPKWGLLGRSSTNDDLCRYFDEMEADPAKVRELIAQPDTFAQSLTVYTYEGGEIIEKQCEAYDWPNCTHDGAMMYENTFSADRTEVIQWAKRNAALSVKNGDESVARITKELAEREAWRDKRVADLAKLNADWPDIHPPKDEDDDE